MTFDDVVRELGLGAEHEVWRASFDTSHASKSSLLNPSEIETVCRWIGLDEGIIPDASEAARGIARTAPLSRLLQHLQHQLFLDPAGCSEITWAWKPLPRACGPCGRMFYPLLLLSAVDHVRQLHARHRIPEHITRDTLSDMAVWTRVHRERFGCWGLDGIGWLSYHWTGRLVRLGRLQFEMAKFPLPFRIMQHVRDGSLLALAEAGLRVRADGQFADADGGIGASDPGVWTTGDGNPVDLSRGCIENRQSTLNNDWREILRRGDPSLSVHIPAIGPLTREACDESFRLAREFFPRHFPDFASRAFFTMTWMLDPQLADHLPAESNLVRFLRRWQLLPLPAANGEQTLERVFGWDRSKAKPEEYDALPQDTSLQRVIMAHLRAGGRWRGGAGFFL